MRSATATFISAAGMLFYISVQCLHHKALHQYLVVSLVDHTVVDQRFSASTFDGGREHHHHDDATTTYPAVAIVSFFSEGNDGYETPRTAAGCSVRSLVALAYSRTLNFCSMTSIKGKSCPKIIYIVCSIDFK